MVAIFPVIEAPLKSLDAREANHPNGLVPRVVAELKKNFPELGVMTDLALDPTPAISSGLWMTAAMFSMTETIAVLTRQAQTHASRSRRRPLLQT